MEKSRNRMSARYCGPPMRECTVWAPRASCFDAVSVAYGKEN